MSKRFTYLCTDEDNVVWMEAEDGQTLDIPAVHTDPTNNRTFTIDERTVVEWAPQTDGRIFIACKNDHTDPKQVMGLPLIETEYGFEMQDAQIFNMIPNRTH